MDEIDLSELTPDRPALNESRVIGTIKITSGAMGEIYVRPASRLGEHFERFRLVCKRAGLSWDRQNANVGPEKALERTLKLLREAGFEVKLGADLLARLQQRLQEAEAKGALIRSTLDRMEEAAGIDLWPHQRADAEFCGRARSSILGNEQRTGKTPTALAVIAMAGRGIVVCPRGARTVWETGCALWTPWMKMRRMLSPTDFGCWPMAGEIFLMHFELMPGAGPVKGPKRSKTIDELVLLLPEIDMALADLVLVIDEAHYLKSASTNRTKRGRALMATVLNHGGRLIQATGTPAPNHRGELWELLVGGRIAQPTFGSKPAFMSETAGWSGGEATGLLSSVMTRRLRKDVVAGMPAKIREPVNVPLDKLSAQGRAGLNRLWAAAQARGLAGDQLLEALLRSPDFSEYARLRAALAEAKIPTMLDLIEEQEEAGQPIVVASCHRSPINLLQDREGWAVVHGDVSDKKRDEAIRRFQARELKGIGITAKTGGLAIELSVAALMIIIDRALVPGDNLQLEDRIIDMARPSKGLLYKILEADHPLEKEVDKLLTRKAREIEVTVDSVAILQQEPDRALRSARELLEEHRPGMDATLLPPPGLLEGLEEAGLVGVINGKSPEPVAVFMLDDVAEDPSLRNECGMTPEEWAAFVAHCRSKLDSA